MMRYLVGALLCIAGAAYFISEAMKEYAKEQAEKYKEREPIAYYAR